MTTRDSTTELIGWTAAAFSLVYLVSDVIELAQGGFSPAQLGLTYAAEAAIPLFVLGLYAAQRPRIGALGLAGATAYAYVYVFFTGTVLYAIVENVPDYATLETHLGAWMTVHSVLMIVAGTAFGAAVIRARVLPSWTGVTLIAGMLLMAVTVSMPPAVTVAAAGVRDLAFAGMGVALIGRFADARHRTRTVV